MTDSNSTRTAKWCNQHVGSKLLIYASHFHLSKRQEKKNSVSAKLIILLTFMNCSMALEDSELDRNKVFGSAWRAGTEKKKTQWLE